jgi:hypothetical protein
VNAEVAGQKTNVTAIVALATAILGFSCFWGIGGILAVLLGLTSLREIERSSGRESGRGLSVAAIALGGLNIAAIIIVAGASIAFMARPTATPPIAVASSVAPPAVKLAPRAPVGRPPTATQPVPSTPLTAVRETTLGRLRVIDVGPQTGGLTGMLETQRRAARLAGEKLLLFVVAPNCLPCNGVSVALLDRRMQNALERVRLVRVDAADHATELLHLGVPVESVPGFALLGDTLRPLDYLHGGEWDADVPENIAPVLRAFVRGSYLRRRHPFRGPERPDETAL